MSVYNININSNSTKSLFFSSPCGDIKLNDFVGKLTELNLNVTIYNYNNVNNSWSVIDNSNIDYLLSGNKGYLIKIENISTSDKNEDIYVSGTYPTSFSFDLKKGWNMVGFYITTKIVTIKNKNGNIKIFKFDETSNDFIEIINNDLSHNNFYMIYSDNNVSFTDADLNDPNTCQLIGKVGTEQIGIPLQPGKCSDQINLDNCKNTFEFNPGSVTEGNRCRYSVSNDTESKCIIDQGNTVKQYNNNFCSDAVFNADCKYTPYTACDADCGGTQTRTILSQSQGSGNSCDQNSLSKSCGDNNCFFFDN